jgi:hypothetical protein
MAFRFIPNQRAQLWVIDAKNAEDFCLVFEIVEQ